MTTQKVSAFSQVLQRSIRREDSEWSYQTPGLPGPAVLNSQHLIKIVTVISNSKKQQIELRLQKAALNRAISADPLDRFLVISFRDFRLRIPKPNAVGSNAEPETAQATARESADYIANILHSGIILNNVHYHFYGHSNSQLKSRTCFLYAASKPDISRKVENLGDFSKIKTVAKKAKRIGLLFSVAQIAMVVEPSRCQDIPDIKTGDYTFTDGCGLISPWFAQELARQVNIAFRNVRYTPSVFQIRYCGYKGVVELDPTMRDRTILKFRNSMKKFSGGNDLSFSVVDYSKPYGFGYLNDEIILLLHSLGIKEQLFLQKQVDHFQYLVDAANDPRTAFRFLTYSNNFELAEKLLMESLDAVQPTILKLVNAEFGRMLNKRDEQRCRILIPKSRLLFGVCDAWKVLKEGECAVKVTMDGDGQPRALENMDILVTRNPCLHPGDLQKFKVVAKPELAHLVDCIVFPSCGRRPAADLLSGGDLDGDTFFVCWDSDLIPEKLAQPAEYPGAKEQIIFKPITDSDRLEYFARSTNSSLGRVKNLYLDWARLKGPMSDECQQLNRLFSQCVDGNRIKVPNILESPPRPSPEACPFILDILHDAAKQFIAARQEISPSLDGYNFDAMELLLCRDKIAMSEFEMVQLTHRWCLKNGAALLDFLHLFDLNILTAEEKTWTLCQVPPSFEISSSIMNSLSQSNLIKTSELQPFKLHYPGLRWKCIYNSSQDRLAVFLDTVARTLELFHRKFIVVRVDERLTLGIYVPQKIERGQEGLVDDRVRLFAFPHSQGSETSHRLSLATKMEYRLYCDSNVFQLFQKTRGNSWVYLVKGASDDSSYRRAETERARRRGRQETLESGLNFDCRASIALDKFSAGLQRHIGRVNRSGVLGAEIYVISNRDVKSMQNLDLWLDFVDTREILPLFERNAREYTLLTMSGIDWSLEPEYVVQLAKNRIMSTLRNLESEKQYTHVFTWLLDRGEKGQLLQCYKYLILQLSEGNLDEVTISMVTAAMLDFLQKAPFLSSAFGSIELLDTSSEALRELLENSGIAILKAQVLAANDFQDFIVIPFRRVSSMIKFMSLTEFAELVELICLTIRSSDLGLDLLLECLEPRSITILQGSEAITRHFVKNMIGIALDHISEGAEAKIPRKDLLNLKLGPRHSSGFWIVQSQLRIDAPAGSLNTSDHVRLTVIGAPINSSTSKPYSIDALVESSQPGQVSFRCFHPPPPYLEDCSWELLNCGSFVTTKSTFDAVLTFAAQPEESCKIAMLLLGTQDGPHTPDTSAKVTPTVYVESTRLNISQNAAVKAAITHPLTCLWGPPGTGKTHTVVEIIKQLQAVKGTNRILVTAPTHNAVDNVMRRYMAEMKGAGWAALRVSTDLRKVAEDLRKHTCDAMMGKEIYSSYSAMNKARDQIKKCRLVFTTCIGASLGLLRSESFDTAIIDEASQQTEPASLVPLVKGCQRAILVGDHVQLGATVQQHSVLIGFDVSLFERLYKQEVGDIRLLTPFSKVMLDTQYRMHEDICNFSSDEFYDHKLLTGIPKTARPIPASQFPWPSSHSGRMLFVECSSPEALGAKSKFNEGQSIVCHSICRLLCTPPPLPNATERLPAPHPAPPTSIAVLTPYSRQASLLKDKLSPFPNVEVSSIDGFQGREAEIVVFVTVRCNVRCEIGFLKDLRRMNVALTRAKTAVLVLGHRTTLTMGMTDLESAAVWKRLLGRLKEVKIDV